MNVSRLASVPGAAVARRFPAWAGLALLAARLHAADPFAENIRPTEPLTPDQEQKTFHLPPGFEIQWVAAEPDINKPMNMAFDATGRLWVTTSREYPFPVAPDKPGRDRVMIFEDFGPDGRARKVTTFAEGLNIPIGLYPFRSPSGAPSANGPTVLPFNSSTLQPSHPSTGKAGAPTTTRQTWKCIVWSIPNLWLLEDTDGDGRADRMEKLYGPMGWERDTHGDDSSFTRGFDGWLYATHGYNNNTDVRGRDGHEVKMNSGNTYRLRLDGSRIEQNTWGQVNPFGLCFDAAGNLYSADCHSEPVYQLLRGGYYPSFGKPHDGLGFAPSMIFHEHGSTAISGIVYYEDTLWPAEYRHNILTGNVMTSRVNRDAVTFTGSTPLANERPDFVVTDDPWFRPVNLQLGPDGALYMADFYNRIIGHYEVPLTHPGRDRERGRIWRIVYKGGESKTAPRDPKLPGTLDGLIDEMGSPNLSRRMLAMNALVDGFGPAALPALRRVPAPGAATHAPAPGVDVLSDAPTLRYAHALWSRERLAGLSAGDLGEALGSTIPFVRVHALRILTERGVAAAAASNASPGAAAAGLKPTLRKPLLAALQDTDALVRRCAAEALGAWPSQEDVRPLLALRDRAPATDTHLVYVVRKALRDQLAAPGVLARLSRESLGGKDERAVADVAVAVPGADAAEFLLRHLRNHSEGRDTLAEYLRHAARYAPEKELGSLASFARSQFAGDLDFQLALFKSVQQGTQQRGAALPPPVRDWGGELAGKLLASADPASLAWINTPIEGMARQANPWFIQQRASADGNPASRFLCSLPPGGESLTGVLRSKRFPIPAKLSFFLAGHDGYPGAPPKKKNVVRLRLAPDAPGGHTTGVTANLDDLAAEAYPPRNDTAQPVTWDLAAFAGRQGYLEVTDGDNGDAYAWLAIGRFDPRVVAVPDTSPNAVGQRQQAAAQLVRDLSLSTLEPQLDRVLADRATEPAVGAAVAQTLVALHPDDFAAALASLIGETAVPDGLRREVARALVERKPERNEALLAEAFKTVTRRFQVRLAESLAGSAAGAEHLLKLVADGRAPAAALLERPVRDRLLASKPANAEARLAQLTRGVLPPSGELQKLIDQRRAAFDPVKASAARGEAVFTLNCRPCHQIDGTGNVVGPQLDGVGGRGLERLLEDVLDPNRNVDPAFHTTLVSLRDGDVQSGLFRREEGEALVLAIGTGKEISIPKKDIVERRASDTSLMPENFGEVIQEQDFRDLMAFLLAHGPK